MSLARFVDAGLTGADIYRFLTPYRNLHLDQLLLPGDEVAVVSQE